MRSTWLRVILFLAGMPVGARQDLQTCGSYPDKGQEELALHRRSRQAQAFKASAARMTASPRVARDIGDIAILEDSEGVISRRNPFNLDRRSLYFVPVDGGTAAYRYQTGESAYDAEAAANGSPLSGLGDDDTRQIALPFAFPYFGRQHTRMFVNSDGNVTFDAGDSVSSERSLGRVTAGPPRIAPFFADLDPSRVSDSVRVLAQSSRVVVTWLAVPQYSDFGIGPLNTVQLALFPDGRIQISFSTVQSRSAVVGIAPGRLAEVSTVVALSEVSDRQFKGAVVERFSDTEEVDIVFAAQKFYESHEDAYDYLAIYNNVGVAAGSTAVAYEVTVRNDRSGIGDSFTDVGREYGSPARLQAVLNLGPLGQYPRNPTGIVPGRATTGDTPLSIIGHETGHLWLAFASVREPANIEGRPMLGRQTAHWAFNFNSEASLLEGNRIEDLGSQARPRFLTVATVEGFSPLDQYLMGLRAPEDVPPTFVVANPSIFIGRPPQRGVAFDGDRRDIHIQELIGAEGRRTPDHTVSQRRFRIAFILITAAGVDPTADQIDQVDTYRRQFEAYFQQATGGRAEVETSLRRSVQVSLAPAAGVLEGATATATVTLARSPEAPLTLQLRAPRGAVEGPAAVTIPAGQTQAQFSLRGVRAGVEELSLDPSDARYAQAFARVQVLGQATALRLIPVSGDKQRVGPAGTVGEAIVAKVVDVNNLPYPGVSVQASAGSGAGVEPSTAVADALGFVRFQWRPGVGPATRLRLSVATAPSVVAEFSTSPGRPVIAADGVVNAASYRYGLTPAGLATIWGTNLAGGSLPVAASLPLPTELSGVRVLLNNQPVRLLYVSDSQINFVAPSSILGNNVPLLVEFQGAGAADRSDAVVVPVRFNDPGIFFNSSTNVAAALVGGTAQTTDMRPVAGGEVLEVYGSGLGAVVASSTPGLAETARRPTAILGGQEAEVLFSGYAPGFPGLYQVNVRVPAGLPPGPQTLVFRIDSS
ncbi:MAG: hypothetical protein JNN08_09420, partial [Bryobacterales bacterium]|nr:hypothetical protein [Bryobacterales bacterium]